MMCVCLNFVSPLPRTAGPTPPRPAGKGPCFPHPPAPLGRPHAAPVGEGCHWLPVCFFSAEDCSSVKTYFAFVSWYCCSLLRQKATRLGPAPGPAQQRHLRAGRDMAPGARPSGSGGRGCARPALTRGHGLRHSWHQDRLESLGEHSEIRWEGWQAGGIGWSCWVQVLLNWSLDKGQEKLVGGEGREARDTRCVGLLV